MTLRRLKRVTALAAEQLDVIIARDSSIRSRGEAALHPAVIAIGSHRVAHRLYRRGLYKTARLLSMVARLASGGIEIHPGAQIGRRFFVDHGSGVVVGETAVIGDDVTLFHQARSARPAGGTTSGAARTRAVTRCSATPSPLAPTPRCSARSPSATT